MKRRLILAVVLTVALSACGATKTAPVAQKAFGALARGSDDAGRILGAGHSAEEIEALQHAGRALPSNVKLTSQSTDFIDALKESDQGVVSIVGHNANGSLMFGDGSKVPIATLGSSIRGRTVVAVIGCNTLIDAQGRVIGIQTPISAAAAVEVQRRFTGWVSSLAAVPSVDAAQEQLLALARDVVTKTNQTQQSQRRAARVAFSVGLGVGGAGVTVAGVEIYQKV